MCIYIYIHTHRHTDRYIHTVYFQICVFTCFCVCEGNIYVHKQLDYFSSNIPTLQIMHLQGLYKLLYSNL